MITDKSSIKALTLLVVSQMNHDVNPDILMSAMLEADCAALSDLVDVIEELVADELLTLTATQSGAKKCSVSDKGMSIMPELADFLPDGIRQAAIRNVIRAYESIAGLADYFSHVEKADDGGYFLVCTEEKSGKNTVEVRMYFPTEKETLAAQRVFEQRPAAVIDGVRAVLTGNADLLM